MSFCLLSTRVRANPNHVMETCKITVGQAFFSQQGCKSDLSRVLIDVAMSDEIFDEIFILLYRRTKEFNGANKMLQIQLSQVCSLKYPPLNHDFTLDLRNSSSPHTSLFRTFKPEFAMKL